MERHGGANSFVIFGALFGLMFYFRWFRFLMLGLGLWIAFLFVQDRLSEYWSPGTDDSLYSFSIPSIERDGYQSKPAFWLDTEIRNNSMDFMQAIEFTAILYECQDRVPVFSRCQALASKPVYMSVNQRPGFLHRERLRITFENTEEIPESTNVVVQLNVDRVSFDRDRKAL